MREGPGAAGLPTDVDEVLAPALSEFEAAESRRQMYIDRQRVSVDHARVQLAEKQIESDDHTSRSRTRNHAGHDGSRPDLSRALSDRCPGRASSPRTRTIRATRSSCSTMTVGEAEGSAVT